MSVPNQYYGSGMHATADLKRVLHRVRTVKPELFALRKYKHTEMNGEGEVSVVETREARATPMSPRTRHAYAMGKGRY